METYWIKFLTFTHDIHINLEYGLGNFNKCVSTKFEHITISDFKQLPKNTLCIFKVIRSWRENRRLPFSDFEELF